MNESEVIINNNKTSDIENITNKSKIDVEIAILTKGYIDRLVLCKNRDEFKAIVEQFNEEKEEIARCYGINGYVFGVHTSWKWGGGLEGSYAWLVSILLYSYPDYDLNLFPDVLRYKYREAMYAIAVANKESLNWFRTSMIEENGERYYTNNFLNIRKFLNAGALKDTKLFKEYLGDGIFLIRKGYKPNRWFVYKDILYKLCYSFEEFAAELNNDLSNAEMRSFDLSQIDLKKYNTTGMTSNHFKVNEEKEEIVLSFNKDELSVDYILDGEFDLDNTLQLGNILKKSSPSGIATRDKNDFTEYISRNVPFYYISDLHLCNILQKRNISSYNEILDVISEIVSSIKESYDKYNKQIFSYRNVDRILFVGDISSDAKIYELFLHELNLQGIKNAIFILGNHEYWGFESIEQSVKWYKEITAKYGYLCLQNEMLLYMDEDHKQYEKIIDADFILNCDAMELIKLTSYARYIIVGGTGFAGCNKNWNAKLGLYRFGLGKDLLTAREIEISESLKFENIHSKLIDVLQDRQIIICTHNPVNDWTFEGFCPNWIYVNGHTHSNRRIINEKKRLYADNQEHYPGSTIKLKYFSVETKNNLFSHYKDGIYTISPIEYQDFMDGRNISMTLSYRDDEIWMLKKSGYYLFMTFKQTAKNGVVVCICDGGRKKKVNRHTPEYYWNNMGKVIVALEEPTIQYSKVIAKVSEYVKSFGGSGRIHGCIVDIDYYCHLFVNINDYKVTPYFAYDVCERQVYGSIEQMLQDKCPDMYLEYKKESGSGSSINAIIKAEKNTALSQYDYGTELYKESNVIKRLDLLRTDKILTRWIDLPDAEIEQKININFSLTANNTLINGFGYHDHEYVNNQSVECINDGTDLPIEKVNERGFCQWLKDDAFCDKVIDKYIITINTIADSTGMNLFSINDVEHLNTYVSSRNKCSTTLERTIYKYYKAYLKR